MNESVLSPVAPAALKATRRRLTQAYKRQVVEQSLQTGASAAQVAREHDINGNLLHIWRWHYRSGFLGPVADQSATLIPVELSASSTNEIVTAPAGPLLPNLCCRSAAANSTVNRNGKLSR